jgi:hypothetical protein
VEVSRKGRSTLATPPQSVRPFRVASHRRSKCTLPTYLHCFMPNQYLRALGKSSCDDVSEGGVQERVLHARKIEHENKMSALHDRHSRPLRMPLPPRPR